MAGTIEAQDARRRSWWGIWQMEWPGCQRAARGLTYAHCYRRGTKQRARELRGGDQAQEAAVEMINRALALMEERKSLSGQVQMGADRAAQVFELLRAAGRLVPTTYPTPGEES
jgi:hypothetical protein